MKKPLTLHGIPEGKIPLQDLCHIALAGRSNAGKSTLANRILNTHIARTSKTPGRTQFIGIYQGNLGTGEAKIPVAVADLPGFGYAKVKDSTRWSWEEEMPRYYGVDAHIITLLCIDPRLPPQESDLLFLDWVQQYERRVFIVAAKWDKCNQSAQQKAQKFAQTYQVHPTVSGWYPVSSLNGSGLETLLEAIKLFCLQKE